MKIMIEKSLQPAITNIKIEWDIEHNKQNQFLQIPHSIPSLFNGHRQVVYGFIDYCNKVNLTAKSKKNFLK
jgi:poly [ADP-ribose] polymerase 2/3/4